MLLSRPLPREAGRAVTDAALSATKAEQLSVSLGSYDGPLDLLLQLARSQKIDLREISILTLAEQYLAFVEEARALRLELAADYLVMAAWLAYLKSRLLLPEPPSEEGEESPQDMAARLAWHLERLQAMREHGARLLEGPRLAVDRFARGAPELRPVRVRRREEASLPELLRAYLRLHTRDAYAPDVIDRSEVYSMDRALERLRTLIGEASGWAQLESFLPEGWQAHPKRRRSATAATFAAVLELVRDGELELSQSGPFGPISLRRTGDNA